MEIIEKELDNLFKNTKKIKRAADKHPFDKTGGSISSDVHYIFTDGASAALVCTDWTNEMTKNHRGIYDHLRLKLLTGKFDKWMQTKAYK